MLIAVLLSAAPAFAQDAVQPVAQAAWTARTGDAWTDRRLADINAYAARYPEAFVDELVRYFDAPRALIEERIARRRAMPGDVYYACAIARAAGRPCRGVLEEWDRTRSEGWAPVLQRLGIEPGSPQATRLKRAIDDSYRHWARPQPKTPAARGTSDKRAGAGA